MTKKGTAICIFLILLLTACGKPFTSTPLSTSQAVILAYPAELRPDAEALAACARDYPDITIFLDERVTPSVPDGLTNLFLAIGSSPSDLAAWHATLLHMEDLVVITNQQNQLTSLSLHQLNAIWSGEITRWEDINGVSSSIQVWTYPSGNMLRTLYDSHILPQGVITSNAWLAPDPQAMLEAIAADPTAIGYLPVSWLGNAYLQVAEQVRSITLPLDLTENFRQPVLALTEVEPQGALRTLLLCYQTAQ